MTVTAADHVLLTGAGFTHNFGAPLAEGIWSLILGHPAIKSTRLRDLLLNDLDYESAYHIVMSSADYVNDDREAMQQAVSAAYEYIDEIVKSWTPTGSIYDIWDSWRDSLEIGHGLDTSSL
ncbi:MAG TPA: hypothetical protein VNJ70_17090 [Thermoanaerobaculia bacterium]|nr:hypothetical protein [Thermoanaerobaculia bacterium]